MPKRRRCLGASLAPQVALGFGFTRSFPQEAPDGKVYSDTIREVKDGQVVWEWKVADKLDPRRVPLQSAYPREHWPLINAIWWAIIPLLELTPGP